MDKQLRNLSLLHLQADELWSFVGKKEENVMPWEQKNGHNIGDTWILLITGAESRLVPSFVVGDRDLHSAEALMADVASRLSNRPQIATDDLRGYIWGVEKAFGADVDFGMLIKSYTELQGRLELTGAQPRPISGRHDPRHISTSYADRNDSNCRLFLRGLTRLTNGFSPKVENLSAALWLYFAHYNFVRIHHSLRITPAIAANATGHVWTIEELLNAGI